MTDHLRCRLSFSEDELELAGPPAALRALAVLLRRYAEPVEVSVTGGTVAQHVTSGPLLVDRQGATTMRLSGGPEYLDIVWDALDGVADEAETTDDRGVNQHQHIEYLPDDEYRSPNSVPLVIVADWPDELVPRTRRSRLFQGVGRLTADTLRDGSPLAGAHDAAEEDAHG